MQNSELPINPTGHQNNDGTLDPYHYLGLTKREHFAGLAMQAYASADNVGNAGLPHNEIAKWAVNMADALLSELEKA